MRRLGILSLVGAGLLLSVTATAQESGVAKPNLLLKQIVEGLPKGEKQEISVVTATLKAGDKTPFHTHRSR